jgi:hypothetical protein
VSVERKPAVARVYVTDRIPRVRDGAIEVRFSDEPVVWHHLSRADALVKLGRTADGRVMAVRISGPGVDRG